MSERERPPLSQQEPASPADRTLLGVAPPPVESSPDPALRSPVFVRSGTAAAEGEPPPLPRMALPSRPAPPLTAAESPAGQSARSASIDETSNERGLERYLRASRLHPALWMVGAPVVLASLVIGVTLALTPPRSAQSERADVSADAASRTTPLPQPAAAVVQHQATLAELEARPPASLSAKELLRVADGRAQRRVSEARAFGEKLEQSPALLAEKATQAEVLRLSRDGETAREALAALAKLETPLAADLLYEVWTGTAVRTEATDLARALLYSPDVRPEASPALAVALDLRVAQSCEPFKALLPRALKEGDRRSLSQLTKLVSKRGCGPRKTDDCYACLRSEPDELTATLSAAKSRRSPLLVAP